MGAIVFPGDEKVQISSKKGRGCFCDLSSSWMIDAEEYIAETDKKFLEWKQKNEKCT